MAYKRLLTGLFICLFSFLLMSHNTFAAELSVPVRLYSTSGYRNASYNYLTAEQISVSGAFNNNLIATQISINYYSMTTFDGLYLDAAFYLYNYNENNSVDGYMNINNVVCNNGNLSCQIAGTSFDGGGSGQIYHVYIYVSQAGSLTNIQFYTTAANSFALRMYDSERMWPLPLTGYRLVENSTTVNVNQEQVVSAISSQNNYLNDIKNAINNINDSEEQATQDAADNSQSSGDQAAADSEQATSSLLNTITGFFNAVINANATNCKFDSHLPFLSGNGEIDLCSIDTPPIVQTLSSLVLVGLFIPFCIHMFNRFISITESFQR